MDFKHRVNAVGLLEELSEAVFRPNVLPQATVADRAVSFADTIDRSKSAEAFLSLAPTTLKLLAKLLPELSSELTAAMLVNDERLLGILRELSWTVAYASNLTFDVRLTAKSGEVVSASPMYSQIKNLDSRLLSIRIWDLDDTFENVAVLNPAAGTVVNIEPGASHTLNGFRQVTEQLSEGVLVAALTSAPLGSYDALYSRITGERLGLFSTDIGLSSCVVALRVFGLCGWSPAADLAASFVQHPLREIRWAALNYFWRTAQDDVVERLSGFLEDPDPQLRALARNCLNQCREVQNAI